MSLSIKLKRFKDQLESESLHLLLDLLGQPRFLTQIRRSTQLRARFMRELSERFEELARAHALATETDLGRLEVKVYQLKAELNELKCSVDHEQNSHQS